MMTSEEMGREGDSDPTDAPGSSNDSIERSGHGMVRQGRRISRFQDDRVHKAAERRAATLNKYAVLPWIERGPGNVAEGPAV